MCNTILANLKAKFRLVQLTPPLAMQRCHTAENLGLFFFFYKVQPCIGMSKFLTFVCYEKDTCSLKDSLPPLLPHPALLTLNSSLMISFAREFPLGFWTAETRRVAGSACGICKLCRDELSSSPKHPPHWDLEVIRCALGTRTLRAHTV